MMLIKDLRKVYVKMTAICRYWKSFKKPLCKLLQLSSIFNKNSIKYPSHLIIPLN